MNPQEQMKKEKERFNLKMRSERKEFEDPEFIQKQKELINKGVQKTL